MYSTIVTQASSGRERRTRLWARPLYRYTFEIGPRLEDVIQEILEYFHAIGGRDCGFRFQDAADYLSCRVGQTPALMDQPIVATVYGSDTIYQLVKQYQFGARAQIRTITKPVAGTIRIANESGVEQPASAWDLDESTGLVIPNGTFSGVPTYWSGEFDVPVRFDSDTLPIIIESRKIESASFTLTELRL